MHGSDFKYILNQNSFLSYLIVGEIFDLANLNFCTSDFWVSHRKHFNTGKLVLTYQFIHEIFWLVRGLVFCPVFDLWCYGRFWIIFDQCEVDETEEEKCDIKENPVPLSGTGIGTAVMVSSQSKRRPSIKASKAERLPNMSNVPKKTVS